MLDPVRPTDDQLRRFLAGTLPDAEAESVGRWVESDPDAAGALARLETPASLADALAAPATRADHTTPAGPPAAPDPTPTLPDGYRLLGVLGHGGMGVVYRAVDTEIDREVAVKVLTARIPAGSGAETRFHDEARITGQLQHPGIPPVYRVGRLPDGRPFLAMKLIKGDTLADLLEARTAEVDRLGVFEHVCQAVGYAHAHGVIHRDLKPHNVMLGTFGEVQVMDWGLAKVLGGRRDVSPPVAPTTPAPRPTEIKSLRDSDTEAGSVLGTPAFMAPEQAIGAADQLDRRTDVFGLGAILAVLLTGRPPYAAADPEATRQLAARAKLKDCFARLDGCGAEPELIALCKKCLSAEPDDRPDDAQAVADSVRRLRAAADERALRAEIEREKATVQAGEQRKRQRVRLGAAAAVAAALLAGTAVSLWQMGRAMQAEERSNKDADQSKRNAEDAERNAAAAEQNADQARTERDAKQLALKAEEEAKEAAEREKTVALTVRDVMKNKLLRQANPFVSGRWAFGQGKQADLTVRAVLDRAAKEFDPKVIGQAFPNQPLVQAEVLEAIGETYEGLLEFETAVRFAEAAHALRVKHLGADHPTTLAGYTNLAFTYLSAGRLLDATKAVVALGEHLERFLAVLPARPEERVGHPALAKIDAIVNRIVERANPHEFVYRQVEPGGLELVQLALHFPKLVGQAERLAGNMAERFGPDDHRTLVAEIFRGFSLHGFMQVEKACGVYEDVLARAERVAAPDARVLDGVRDILAATYEHLKTKPDARLRLLKDGYESRAKVLSPDHPATLTALGKLADAHMDVGQPDEALPLLEEAHARMKTALGADHSLTLSVMIALAECYRQTGRPDDALRLGEQTYQLAKAKLGADNPDVVLVADKLADAYQAAGAADKAVPLFEEALRWLKVKPGAGHPDTLWVQSKLGVCYWRLGRFDKSVPLFEEALRLYEKRFDRKHPLTRNAVANLGVNYKAAGRVNDALPLLEEAYKASAGQPNLRYVSAHLLDGYAKAGKKDEAVKLAAELLGQARKAFPKDSPQLAGQLAESGAVLLELGAFADAEPLVRECLDIREKKAPQAWSTANARVMVGWAALGQKRYADAEPLLLKGYDGLKEREKDIPKGGEERLPEALDRLVELYTAWDKPDEAKKYQALRAKYPAKK